MGFNFLNRKWLRICLLVLVIVISVLGSMFVVREYFKNPETVLYFRIRDSLEYDKGGLELMQTMKDVIKNENIQPASEFYQTNFLLFETLNSVDEVLAKITYPRDVLYIYGLKGTDFMASKSLLASTLKAELADTIYASIMPKTYILENQTDTALLIKEFNPDNVYILKKNVQRQTGNMLTKDINVLIATDPSVVVAQVMLQNPYIVNGRKINMRVYMLVVVDETNHSSFYVYNNGFMYYTPKMFKVNSLDMDEVITTGYVDRKVYVENPLDFEDLKVHMQRKGDDFSFLMTNIVDLMRNVSYAYTPLLQKENENIPGKKFLIYGCDIAPDQNLNVKLMEINKGPDLSYKDDRDKKIKQDMVAEAFYIVGLKNKLMNAQRNFIKLT